MLEHFGRLVIYLENVIQLVSSAAAYSLASTTKVDFEFLT
jgi:hypothetical protein